MSKRALIDKSIEPTDEAVKDALQGCYGYYRSLSEVAKQFDTKWTFHKGWLQKFFDRKKALFYFTPHEGSFNISMTIRENEKDQFLADESLSSFHDQLEGSEKYLEGYAVIFEIDSEGSYRECETFINALINVRKK